jgi:hypothetical protein
VRDHEIRVGEEGPVGNVRPRQDVRRQPELGCLQLQSGGDEDANPETVEGGDDPAQRLFLVHVLAAEADDDERVRVVGRPGITPVQRVVLLEERSRVDDTCDVVLPRIEFVRHGNEDEPRAAHELDSDPDAVGDQRLEPHQRAGVVRHAQILRRPAGVVGAVEAVRRVREHDDGATRRLCGRERRPQLLVDHDHVGLDRGDGLEQSLRERQPPQERDDEGVGLVLEGAAA